MMKKTLLLSAALAVLASKSQAQLKKGAWGITGGIGGSNTVGAVYNLQENFALGLNLLFNSSTAGSTSNSPSLTTSSFGAGVSGWYYVASSENLSAYVGGNLSFTSNSQDYTDTPTSKKSGTGTTFSVGALYGAQYWFSTRFSLYGNVGLAYSSSTTSPPSPAQSYTNTNIGTNYSTGLIWYLN